MKGYFDHFDSDKNVYRAFMISGFVLGFVCGLFAMWEWIQFR